MRFRKIFVLLFVLLFCGSGIMAANECKPSYRNVRKISKNKKMQSKRSKAYKKRTSAKSKSSRPINTSYVVKSKRKTTYHY
jgi:hypothetical protein